MIRIISDINVSEHMHSEKGLVKSTTHIQLSTISSHQTIFISITYGVVGFIKVT